MINGPMKSGCFLGDSRTFTSYYPPRDSEGNYLYRISTIVALYFPDPTIAVPGGSPGDTGITTKIDCTTGQLIKTGQASTDGIQFEWGNVTPYSASVRLHGSASNPLVLLSPPIEYDLNFAIGLNSSGQPDSGGVITYSGKVGEYPAFEAYIKAGTRPTATIFQISPAPDADVWDLEWRLLRKDVSSKTVRF